MSDKYNIEYLIKAKDSLYLEVECSIAEDIDCAIQWAINRIKQLEEINTKLAEQLEASMGDYTDANKKIKQLEEQIADMNDAYKVVMDEKCADDEIHCTCVPALRQQIKELELGIQKISTEVFKIWEYYKRQNEPNADSYLRIYDDLKALEGK